MFNSVASQMLTLHPGDDGEEGLTGAKGRKGEAGFPGDFGDEGDVGMIGEKGLTSKRHNTTRRIKLSSCRSNHLTTLTVACTLGPE